MSCQRPYRFDNDDRSSVFVTADQRDVSENAPENYSILSKVIIFSGLKYPKNILSNFENKITGLKSHEFYKKLSLLQMGNEVEPLGKSQISMRMANDAVACELTGFGFNSVGPICSKTAMPIIMSSEIAKLSSHFFLGAGEEDLKIGMHSADFIKAFADVPVYVVDCTMSE